MFTISAVATAAAQQSAELPADFAFRFESKPCATTTLDTYTNTYTRVETGEATISNPLTLSPKQMAAVYATNSAAVRNPGRFKCPPHYSDMTERLSSFDF